MLSSCDDVICVGSCLQVWQQRDRQWQRQRRRRQRGLT